MSITDRFLKKDGGSTAPARKAIPVTTSDSDLLVSIPRGLYIGVSGDVKVTLADDNTAVIFKSVPVGLLPVMVKQVFATGTTATNILALY